jgi:hypothetical protein
MRRILSLLPLSTSLSPAAAEEDAREQPSATAPFTPPWSIARGGTGWRRSSTVEPGSYSRRASRPEVGAGL